MAQQSSFEPIAKISSSENRLLRFILTLCLLLVGGLTIHFISMNIIEFFSYPVTTKIRYQQKDSAEFPAVAFCNTNPYQTDFAFDYIIEFIETFSNFTLEYKNQTNQTRQEFILNHIKEYDYYLKFRVYTSNESIKKKLGMGIDEMLIDCTFNGDPCNSSNFVWFYTFEFSCYEFIAPGEIYVNGENGALKLDLFSGFEQLNPTVGFRFLIYNRSDIKWFSLSESYWINTDHETSIYFQRKFINKLPYPYSDCQIDMKTATIDTFDSNLYRYLVMKNKIYDDNYCFRTAYILESMKQCQCSIEDFSDLSGNGHICHTKEEIDCDQQVYYNDFLKKRFYGSYDQQCPLVCNRHQFNMGEILQAFTDEIDIRLFIENKKFFDKLIINKSAKLKKSIARVKVYYTDIGYEDQEEIATFNVIDVISNIGGTLGLFLGLSIFSFIETVYFIAQVLIYIFAKIKLKMSRKVEPTI